MTAIQIQKTINMKKICYIIISFALLFSSCTQDVLYQSEEPVTEGKPVKVRLDINPGEYSRSGLSPSQEKKIKNIFVLVFDKSGHKVSQSYFSSNITANLLNMPTVSGNNMSVYVVANLSLQNTTLSDPSTYFNQVYTIDELNNALVHNLSNDLCVNLSLTMYGSKTNFTIPSTGTLQVPITLKYVVAKVTLYMVTALTNTSDSYNLTNWTVKNYPLKSYLFPQANDAANPSVASDFADSETSVAWVDTTIVINGTNTAAKYAFLYMFENRRGTNSNTSETQKALNAPSKSTAMVLQGYYKTNATNTVTGVTTTVYLGNNNYNDYNVNRGNEYSYIATVKGINKINIDSRVESNTYGYQVNLYNTTLDCHPDWRPLQINSWPGKSTINIYNSDGITPCTWLHVSAINLNQAVNNLRPTYNPATDMSDTITVFFPINTPQSMISKMVYLYADENLTTSSRSAIIKVTSTENLGNSQTITIPATQRGYQTMGNVGFRTFSTTGAVNTASDYILVVEHVEEAALNLTPGAPAGTEATTTMQWGYNLTVAQPTANAVSDYYYRDGFLNTLWLVYHNTTGNLSSTLVPPFGRLSAATSSTASVTITENAMNPIYNTYPARYCFEKNRDLDGDGKITNPNTQGIDEIYWYLPSADELYSTYVGQYALTNALTGANYQVSCEVYGSNSSTNSMSYGTGIGGPIGKTSTVSTRCVRRIYQPQPQATPNSPYVETGTRIINNNGYSSTILRATNIACPTPINGNNSTINSQLSRRFQVAAVNCLLYGSSGSAGMTWAQANGWTSVSDNSNNTGVIASPATGCQAYSETGAPAGTWRLPTQREMYIILFMRREIAAGQDGFVKLSGAQYWTSSTLGGTLGWYGVVGNSTLAFGGKTTNQLVRCIRDL